MPWLSDPMKLQAGKAWGDHTTAEFLAGWARIAATYPSAAIGATMANTVGYWDPEGPSYDGMSRWSSNNADHRRIHLAIPGVSRRQAWPPPSSPAGSSDANIRERASRRRLPRYSGVGTGHVAGLGVLVVADRRPARDQTAGSEGSRGFIPAAALLLSFLAGPVSGGQRYSLTLFMALPLAIAAVALARRKGESRETNITEINNEPDRERIQAALADTSGHRLWACRCSVNVRGQPSEPARPWPNSHSSP